MHTQIIKVPPIKIIIKTAAGYQDSTMFHVTIYRFVSYRRGKHGFAHQLRVITYWCMMLNVHGKLPMLKDVVKVECTQLDSKNNL